jgi:hypothetical protein
VARWEYAWVIYNPESGGAEEFRLLFSHHEAPPLTAESSVLQTVRTLGDEGWELASTLWAKGSPAQLWFKRPLESPSEREEEVWPRTRRSTRRRQH